MVAGNRENRSRIILVGLVELRTVQFALAIEIDDVPDVIEERRLVRCQRRFDLALHRFGDRHLNVVPVDASGIADDMEHELSRACNCSRCFRNDHV